MDQRGVVQAGRHPSLAPNARGHSGSPSVAEVVSAEVEAREVAGLGQLQGQRAHVGRAKAAAGEGQPANTRNKRSREKIL